MGGERFGIVTHYFNHLNVAVARVEKGLKLGDLAHFLGAHTDFGQKITSMEIEHRSVSEVEAGHKVAIKVRQRVRGCDSVYRVSDGPAYELGEEFTDMAF